MAGVTYLCPVHGDQIPENTIAGVEGRCSARLVPKQNTTLLAAIADVAAKATSSPLR